MVYITTFYSSQCFNIWHIGFIILIYLSISIYIYFGPFGVDCLHYAPLPPILQHVFTENMNIFSHNHSTLSCSGNLPLIRCFYLIYGPYSKFISCLDNILRRLPWTICTPGLHTTCHVSLVFFNMKRFLSLPLSFMILRYLKSTDQLFYEMYLNLSLFVLPYD